jgi:competence protein ComEC
VGILVFILFLRLAINYFGVNGVLVGRKLSVMGKVDNVYQSGTLCIVSVGKFRGNFEGKCSIGVGGKVEMIGRTRWSLIDGGLGRIWLDEADIRLISLGVVGAGEGFRARLVGVYQKLLPAQEAALVAGIVLGDKTGLNYNFYQRLIRSGTVHIVVASGYNVMIVGGTVLSILLYLWKRKWASLGAVVVMAGYAVLAGGAPPVVRAVVMGVIILIAPILGRQSVSWWSLLLAGWVMVLIEPAVMESISFQLTMAASVGLMIVEPWLKRRVELIDNRYLSLVLRTEFMPTLSASLLTLPFIWWHLGRVGWWGLVTNLVVLPLVPVVMFLGALSLVLGVIWLPLGQVVAWLTYALAHLVVVIVGMF